MTIDRDKLIEAVMEAVEACGVVCPKLAAKAAILKLDGLGLKLVDGECTEEMANAAFDIFAPLLDELSEPNLHDHKRAIASALSVAPSIKEILKENGLRVLQAMGQEFDEEGVKE